VKISGEGLIRFNWNGWSGRVHPLGEASTGREQLPEAADRMAHDAAEYIIKMFGSLPKSALS
jgi:hypothetical protein